MAATTAQISYSDDWKWWDNTESISVQSYLPGGATTTTAVSDAFRGDIERKTSTLLGVEISEDGQIWSVPASLMGAVTIRQSDTITDVAGTVWIVDASTLVTIGTSPLYWLVATHKKR